jgi:hypothetical protein
MNDTQTTEVELWHVQLSSGQVRCWTLDRLDEGFQRDEVGPQTYVCRVGDTEWQRLGLLLGLEAAPANPAPAPVVAPTMVSAVVPARPSEVPSANSVGPVAMSVHDIDDDVFATSMKPKRKKLGFVAGGVAVALVLGIVALTRIGGSADDKGGTTAAAQPPSATGDVAAASKDPAAQAMAHADLSDEVKKSLLEADKVRAAKAAARAAEAAKNRPTTSAYHPVPKSGPVFHKGGNQYDPLNSAP